MKTVKSRIVYGFAIGDAMGVPFEFKGTIRNAINFGFDTDSHAALAAAMSTIKHKIPQTLIDGLSCKEKIDNILKQVT